LGFGAIFRNLVLRIAVGSSFMLFREVWILVKFTGSRSLRSIVGGTLWAPLERQLLFLEIWVAQACQVHFLFT
jgi:hypothetical protein